MKILYFCKTSLQSNTSVGVLKKVYGHLRCMYKNGNNVYFANFVRDELVIKNSNLEQESVIRFQSKLDSYEKLINIIKKYDFDIIYIRYTFSNYYFMRFLDEVKLSIPTLKIVMEIPTYPYDGELANHEKTLFLDTYFRKYLKEYVDRIILWNEYEKVFDIPTIIVKNGVEVEKISVHKPKETNNILNLIGVANVSKWHGYDRIIEGLKIYYNNDNEVKVFFYIVGEGAELNNLKNLVSNLKLEKYVIFEGVKIDRDLDNCYNNCHLAVSALGIHRVGMPNRSTLKSVEYCAKGIPFLVGHKEENFSEKFPFIMQLPSNDEPANIRKIVEFYAQIKHNRDLSSIMRQYAIDNLTWDVTMKPLFNYFNSINL